MELEIIRMWKESGNDTVESNTEGSLPYSSYDFIEKNKLITIPYLTFISGLTFIGTFGNMLVLGTLIINKASIFQIILNISYYYLNISNGAHNHVRNFFVVSEKYHTLFMPFKYICKGKVSNTRKIYNCLCNLLLLSKK